ncbi:MAG: hypothetical protein JNN05_00215 [Candidatus Omnitrophica bacterium]|nr:hypothetical protein [Candidatus Omnitrophota bacterium]
MSLEDLLRQQPRSIDELPQSCTEGFLRPVSVGLVRAVLLSTMGEDYPLNQESFRMTARYTILKMLGMPAFLRLPMIILTMAFDVCGLLFGGKMFRYLSYEKQRQQFLVWQKSSIGPCRDLIMFYQKMGIFIYFSFAEQAGAVK